jgi:hypothetical protein
MPGPALPDAVFEGPPSRLVDRAPRDSPGPIDRLWADRSIDALFVNGPGALHVERNGVLEASAERFRDHAHLREFIRRLVPHPSSPAVPFRLRDGGEGLVIFPPAAPDGPVLVLRRGAAGEATFERLVALAILDRAMADLLRIAARCRLNMLVVGPARSGKTALLAALARDLGEVRVVTLARHRAFHWPSPSKVELVVPADSAFATLLAAAAQLAPHLLVVDPVRPHDGAAGRLRQRSHATRRRSGHRRWQACRDERSISSSALIDCAMACAAWSPWKTKPARRSSFIRPAGLVAERPRRLCRARAQGGLWRGACKRARPITATGRHIPSKAENPLPARPISGTNRFEMRGILRAGTLTGTAR